MIDIVNLILKTVDDEQNQRRLLIQIQIMERMRRLRLLNRIQHIRHQIYRNILMLYTKRFLS